MQTVEDLAYETYNKNIEYISSNHKKLMNVLNTFEIALDTKDYIQEFDLEYVDDKYFDIKTLSSDHYLYAHNSIDISKQLYNNLNTSKNTFAFEGLPIYKFSEKELKNFGDQIKSVDGLFPLMTYYYETVKESYHMIDIAKYIFIGTGLGMHIELIHEQIHAKQYLIIEDNLEVFKLSLFTTKYYEIAMDAKLYLSIAEDENNFLHIMYDFLADDFFHNRYLKYTHFPKHSSNKIKQIQNSLVTQSFIFFPYKAEENKFLRPLEYLNDGYNIIDLKKHFQESIFSNHSAFVLGAGPSLKQNIEWIQKNKDKFIIISASANLSILHEYNIQPDIITHLDGTSLSLSHFEKVEGTNYLDNTLMIFGSNTPAKIRKMFKKKQIYFYEENTYYFDKFGSIGTPCVGSFSIILSLLLNVKTIYLLGLDLALNQETGATHGNDDHVNYIDRDMSNKDNLSNTMGHTQSIIPIQGNFKETVYTTPLLHSSVQSLYRLLPSVKDPDQSVYNLSNGAKINGALPKHIHNLQLDNIKSIDKNEFSKSLVNLLASYSHTKLNSHDVLSMKQRLSKSYEIKELLNTYTKSVSHVSNSSYCYDLLGLVSSILKKQDRESVNLSYVYFSYFKFSLPIIFDVFNTKELTDETLHIKTMDSLLQNEMYVICDDYIEKLEKFLEERC